MSFIPLLGAILVVALTNVLAGMLPGTLSGDPLLAVRLMSLLFGVFTYVALQRETARVA
jgi:hypothetical protein